MKKFILFIFMAMLISTAISEDLLKPGETRTYTSKYTVKDTDICSDIVNNATVNANDPCSKEVTPAKDTETVHTKYKADIRFDKVSNKSGEEVDAGGIIEYTYYVENTGDVNLTIVSLVDDMITPVQYISGDENRDRFLNPGEVWTYEGFYGVVEDDLCFDIVNTATLKATDPCNRPMERKDREVVKTTCIGRVCCQDRTNLERIESGDQKAIGFQNGKAKNNVKIVTNQMGGD
jgi:uncharacterized repeat protein (TIGR01451 family)